MTEYQIKNCSELDSLQKGSFLWRQKIGMIILYGEFENHPQKSYLQNELNTHYYACGCDESASGFFVGVVLGCVWIASSWFEGATPSLVTILIGFALAAIGGLIGKAVGKLIANRKLTDTVRTLQGL